MKVITGSGTYYKFLIKDGNNKQAYVKIDEVHPQVEWSTEEWKEKYAPQAWLIVSEDGRYYQVLRIYRCYLFFIRDNWIKMMNLSKK